MTTGRKIALAAVAAAALWFLGHRIYLASLSDETRIRRLVAEMEEAFNEGAAGRIADRLAPSFTEADTGLGRDGVRAFLARFFFESRDPQSRERRHRVEVAPGEVEVALKEGDPGRAGLTVTARFFTRTRAEPSGRLSAVVRFSGELAKLDGQWRIARASHRVLEGKLPF